MESIVTYKLQKGSVVNGVAVRAAGWCARGVRALSRRGNTQHRMRVAAHTVPSECGISGREAGFPDEGHSFIRGAGRRFGRMAKVNGAVTGTRGGWGAWGTA
ncbi:hypothetical protein BCCH1_23060 [Burkholderia contaminans]|uniref:Uncharacterized protein n=1 Tax=Burkholderia contaminans TaxID=488447 RepID=A0A250L5N1_9BURK|nr:hypothetical protein BCCH1_23060 [Burkholderia contaminans]GLZ69353.1 hypothetical protein Bcon01_23980 [Burkholderia contaminans]